jgi:protein SCO1/2
MSDPLRVLKLIRIAAWSLVALLGAVSLFLILSPEKPKGVAIGGPFTMTSMNGERLNTATLTRGKPYGVFFGFTQCPDVCPTTMWELSETMRKAGARAKDFRVFFVSVDPERDTPELLKSYISAFDDRIIGMVGSLEEIAEVARAHRAYYRKVPTPSGYTMDHTATVYLFDRRGELFGTFGSSDSEESRRAKLDRLLKQ